MTFTFRKHSLVCRSTKQKIKNTEEINIINFIPRKCTENIILYGFCEAKDSSRLWEEKWCVFLSFCSNTRSCDLMAHITVSRL